eukprot:SAG31_NODE_3486_length_4210_cov_1.754074_7_plen_86_part_00
MAKKIGNLPSKNCLEWSVGHCGTNSTEVEQEISSKCWTQSSVKKVQYHRSCAREPVEDRHVASANSVGSLRNHTASIKLPIVAKL